MTAVLAHTRPMSEVILEELIIGFDGTVVEIFYAGRGDSDRFHIAQLESAELLHLDARGGPTFNLVGTHRGGVALNRLKVKAAELPALQQVVSEINEAASPLD